MEEETYMVEHFGRYFVRWSIGVINDDIHAIGESMIFLHFREAEQ